MRVLRRIGRSLLLRCPDYGSDGVVLPWAKVIEARPRCSHHFEREEGYRPGAVLRNTAVAVGLFALLLTSMAALTRPDVRRTTVLIVTIAVNPVFPVLFYPWAGTLWIAIDLSVRPADDTR